MASFCRLSVVSTTKITMMTITIIVLNLRQHNILPVVNRQLVVTYILLLHMYACECKYFVVIEEHEYAKYYLTKQTSGRVENLDTISILTNRPHSV